MNRSAGIYSATTTRDLEIALLRPDHMDIIESIARVCHEANRTYCAAIGDHSQKPWDEAPQWQRDSALSGVKFHIAYPDATPEDSHVEWLEGKSADGWQYGPVKDETKKEHPCIVPYHELPIEQQNKDYLFRAIVHALKPRHA